MTFQFPDDLIEELQQIAWDDERNKWRVGDIADELIVELRPDTHDVIYKEIAKWTNKSRHTIRAYREMSDFWPKELRLQYEQISWTHIKAIKGAAVGDTMHDKRADACRLIDKCLEESDDWGGVPSVDRLRSWLHQENGSPPAWRGYVDRIGDYAAKTIKQQDAPTWVHKLARHVLDIINTSDV